MPHVSPQPSRPVRVLFVCLGNICRSPSAEGLFRHYVASQGAEGDYEIDSAGLIAHHEGELPDGRMRAHAAPRGDSPARLNISLLNIHYQRILSTCSFIFSNSFFISTTICCIAAWLALEPKVLISRPISCAMNPSLRPLDCVSSKVARK